MKIDILEAYTITLGYDESGLYCIKEGDLIMFRGDTFIVRDLRSYPNGTTSITITLIRRAADMYALSYKGKLTHLMSYIKNCSKEK